VAQPGGLTLGFALHLVKLESCYRDTHTNFQLTTLPGPLMWSVMNSNNWQHSPLTSFTWKQNLLSRTPKRRRLKTVHEAMTLGGPADWLLRVVRHNVGP